MMQQSKNKVKRRTVSLGEERTFKLRHLLRSNISYDKLCPVGVKLLDKLKTHLLFEGTLDFW